MLGEKIGHIQYRSWNNNPAVRRSCVFRDFCHAVSIDHIQYRSWNTNPAVRRSGVFRDFCHAV